MRQAYEACLKASFEEVTDITHLHDDRVARGGQGEFAFAQQSDRDIRAVNARFRLLTRAVSAAVPRDAHGHRRLAIGEMHDRRGLVRPGLRFDRSMQASDECLDDCEAVSPGQVFVRNTGIRDAALNRNSVQTDSEMN